MDRIQDAQDDDWLPALTDSPFSRLGGEGEVRRLVERFYDVMQQQEPELAQLHRLDDSGNIARDSRDRFALFLVGWLGGPQTYMEQHGHPRLRMRHADVRVNETSRDAWLRCMTAAMDSMQVQGGLRRFLDGRFSQVADFLRNG